MAETLFIASIICFVLSAALLVITIILFFSLRIQDTTARLLGQNQVLWIMKGNDSNFAQNDGVSKNVTTNSTPTVDVEEKEFPTTLDTGEERTDTFIDIYSETTETGVDKIPTLENARKPFASENYIVEDTDIEEITETSGIASQNFKMIETIKLIHTDEVI